MNDSSDSNRTLSKKARIKLDDDASLTDLFDEFQVDEKTKKRVFDALKLAAVRKDEVRSLEHDLRGLQRCFGDLEVEKLVLRAEVARLQAELVEQKTLMDDMDRQRRWQDVVERESMTFNSVLLDMDELEEFSRDPSPPPPPVRTYPAEDTRRLERRAKKAVTRAKKARITRRRIRKAVKRTNVAIEEAKFIADNAEVDTFILRQHKEALTRLVENAPNARREAKESLNDLVDNVRACFEDSHARSSAALQTLLQKHKDLSGRMQRTEGSLPADSYGSFPNNSVAPSCSEAQYSPGKCKNHTDMSQLLRARGVQILAARTKFCPPKNMPYAGIYRQEGETVRKDELLVVQRRMNYHPGANVYHMPDRRRHLLKADCDGTVMITREKAEVDPSIKEMQTEYEYRNYEGLYKLTFHVIPSDMSNRFRLVDEV